MASVDKNSTPLEIHFVTGKGGVGKSTIAAAMASSFAQEGRKTLLVELSNQSFFETFFKLPKATVSYRASNLRPHLDVAAWSGPECLREYALHLLKLQALYRLFFENPVSRALLNVAPALPELAIMGKITSGPPRNVGPAIPYEVLVIDAYATGHFLALMRAPKGMAEAIRVGPMGEQSRQIDHILRTKTICHYHLVTLPEEMPAQEARELADTLATEFSIEARVILNKVYPKSPGLGSDEFNSAMKDFAEDQRLATEILGTGHFISLPYVFATDPWSLIEALQQGLKL